MSQNQEPEQVKDSLLFRSVRSISNSVQSSLAGYYKQQKVKYFHQPTERSVIDIGAYSSKGSKNVSAADFAKKHGNSLKTQMLANELLYQEQNSSGILIRLSFIDSVFSFSFVLNIMSASVIAWVFSRDIDNVSSEHKDQAFLALFSSILFTMSFVLFTENLLYYIRKSYLDFADMFSLYVAKSIETSSALLIVLRWWMKMTRWNFYFTAVMLFASHIVHENTDTLRHFPLPEQVQSYLAPVIDMKYVRPSTVLDPYAERPSTNTIAVLAQMFGFYIDSDHKYNNVLFYSGSITDNNMIRLDKPSTITTENIAGKLVMYVESFDIGDNTVKMIIRALELYASGVLAADTIYRFAIENAFIYMPQRIKNKTAFRIF